MANQQLSASESRAFNKAIGVEVDAGIVLRALTHRSYAYEKGGLPTTSGSSSSVTPCSAWW